MADDVNAKILLTVEYVDAVQKCKDVEVGLEEVTEARKKDIIAVTESTSASKSNSETLKREAEATKNVTKAIKEKNKASAGTPKKVTGAEVLGLSPEEYERRAKAAAQASAKSVDAFNARWDERLKSTNPEPVEANPKRKAAIEELQERKRIMQEVGDVTQYYHRLSTENLNEEIATERIRNAVLRQRVAIEKQIQAQSKLDMAEADLMDKTVRGDPEKLLQTLKERDKYQKQLSAGKREELAAERELRKLQTESALEVDRGESAKAAQVEVKKYQSMTNQALDDELDRLKIIEAEQKRISAVEKERIAQKRLLAAQESSDPRLREQIPTLQKDYNDARKEVLLSERDLRRANKSMKELNKTVSMSESVFGKAARGIGRGLNFISRLGGAGIGMEMSTEGMQGKGGGFLAASMAIGGIVMLTKGIKNLYDENRTADIERGTKNLDEMRTTSDRLKAENQERRQAINTLRTFDSVEKLNNVQRVQQRNILRNLNRRLGNFSVEIDQTTGKIKNLGSLEEALLKKDTEDRLGVLQQELQQAMSERAKHEKFLSDATAFTQVYDMSGIKEASAAEQQLSKRIIELQKEIGKLNKTISNESTSKRWEMRNAKLNDDISHSGLNIINLNREMMRISENEKWIGREKEREEHNRKRDEERITLLLEKRKKAEREIFNLRNEYVRAGLEGDYEKYNQGAEKHKRINIDLLKITKEIRDIRSRQFDRRQQDYMQRERQKEYRLAFSQSTAGFAQRESFKYRDTTTAAVMANSLEGMRLQSRQLIANTPQQKLLQQSQKQTSLLEDISRRVRTMSGSASVTIQSQSV